MMLLDFLKLSWQIQLTIAGGYAAYTLAYVGIREHHKTIDIAFFTIVFGTIIAYLGKTIHTRLDISEILSVTIGLFVALFLGLSWRIWGKALFRKVLRVVRIYADDDPSTWKAFFSDAEHYVTQVAVRLDDGTWLECEDTTRFANSPFGPCVLGASGDLALYVTQSTPPDGIAKKDETVQDAHYGDRLVYIPANRVRECTIRFKKRR